MSTGLEVFIGLLVATIIGGKLLDHSVGILNALERAWGCLVSAIIVAIGIGGVVIFIYYDRGVFGGVCLFVSFCIFLLIQDGVSHWFRVKRLERRNAERERE